MMNDPTATEVPTKQSCLSATHDLFEYLPKYKEDPKNEEYITRLQLASFASLYHRGLNVKGPQGLSHTLGYALGAPYGIPHGITSCITLAGVVKLKADNPREAEQIARILPFIGEANKDDKEDAKRVGDKIQQLVKGLGLETSVKDYNVGEDQVPVITKRATRVEEGQLFESVAALVKKFF